MYEAGVDDPPAVAEGVPIVAVHVEAALALPLDDGHRVVSALEEHVHGLAAELSGVPTTWIKLLAYALGAAFASVAGAFFAAKLSYTNPNFFLFMESCIVLCIVVLGGVGSIPGIVIAAFVLIAAPEVFRGLERQIYHEAAPLARLAGHADVSTQTIDDVVHDRQAQARALRTEIQALHSDRRTIERIARTELGMVREDELVFQFRSRPGGAAPPNSSSPQ